MLNIAALRQQQIPLAAEPRSPVPFHILMKPIGPACNLACRYCYYPQDETPVNKMDEARLEQFIRRYIAAQPVGAREINFVWQGGEPLLAGLSFYKKALALQARYAPDGVTISNSLQTNGTLINDAWCRLFREHRFIIGLSLEGSEALQDQHRPDKRGRASWPAALRGIGFLHQHQVDFNLLVVVHNEMAAHAAAIYDRLVSLGARYLQFQPLMSEGAALREGYQLSADNWGAFYGRHLAAVAEALRQGAGVRHQYRAGVGAVLHSHQRQLRAQRPLRQQSGDGARRRALRLRPSDQRRTSTGPP
ncbi:arylsulfatase regulator [Klebsiella quasipneumoniae]|nr:arylsulfatase regulator [Klebsiella quasipneumoniae]